MLGVLQPGEDLALGAETAPQLGGGETASAYVSLPRVPAALAEEARGEDLGSAVEAACAPGYVNCDDTLNYTLPDASRCTLTFYASINFSTAPVTTNVDWNTLSDTSFGLNDEISSLATTCAPVYFFKDANWSSYGLYIPANTSVSDLRTYGFNDSISSLWHVLP